MSRNRFQALLACLHFSSDESQGRLKKILPVITSVNKKFQSIYLPQKDICIDESLLLWKGRLGFRQYIPTKRSRYGIKSYELCESSTGYVWNFVIYTGRDTQIIDGKEPYGERVVMTLLDALKGHGYNLYTDRFFSSPDLAQKLLDCKTHLCGTVQKNRKNMPKQFPPTKMEPGTILVRQKNNLKVVAWQHQKSQVLMLTTVHEPSAKPSGKTNRSSGEPILKPECVLQYNANMGGVDMCDGMLQNYPSTRKTIKWYKKVFFRMVDVVINNSCIIFKKLGHNITSLQFRRDLAESLMNYSANPEIEPVITRSPHESPLRLTEAHFPSIIPTTVRTKKPRRACTVCQNTC